MRRFRHTLPGIYLFMIFMGLAMVFSACAPVADTADDVIAPATTGSETYTLGQRVYTTYCAACHGADGAGQFPDAPMEPDATGRYGAPPHNDIGHTWHHDDDLLIRYVREGGIGDPASFYPMPAFGDQLSDDEIYAVIAYIKTMWTSDQQDIQRERTLASRTQ